MTSAVAECDDILVPELPPDRTCPPCWPLLYCLNFRGMHQRTVECHVHELIERLGLGDRYEIAVYFNQPLDASRWPQWRARGRGESVRDSSGRIPEAGLRRNS